MNILHIQFKNEIGENEIPLLRGALIGAFDNKENLLLHNHIGDEFRYKYPLVQYKRINGKAALICIGEGIDLLGRYFLLNNLNIQLKTRPLTLEVDQIIPLQHHLKVADKMQRYNCTHWLPFNQENYTKYLQLDSLVKKYDFLEKILVGNMLSFAKHQHVFLEERVQCSIVDISIPESVIYKKIKMIGFTLQFKSNIELPDYIGLGKGVSLGYGEIKKIS